jgi:phosphatidylglycerophosphate synthase
MSPIESKHGNRRRQLPVALYIPNLLCYFRIILAFLGLHFDSTQRPTRALATWILSACLDFLDGILARALNQTSSLGVILDILADNVLRTAVWIAVAATDTSSWLLPATAIVVVEWITMVSTQVHAAQSDTHWKIERANDPWWIRTFFRNNFRNPLGFIGIFGLFSANLCAYASLQRASTTHNPADAFLFLLDTAIVRYVAFLGRGIALCVELRFCIRFAAFIIDKDKREVA